MPLDLPDGTACFIDANIFYYHCVETPPFSQDSTALLERVATGTITGYSATHVLAEAIHKIMLAEAAATFVTVHGDATVQAIPARRDAPQFLSGQSWRTGRPERKFWCLRGVSIAAEARP